jgi:hypothetical protein
MTLRDSTGLKLFRAEANEWKDASNVLRDRLKDPHPLVRHSIVHILREWVEYDVADKEELKIRIEETLKSLLAEEHEPIVRLEAERALQRLQSGGAVPASSVSRKA